MRLPIITNRLRLLGLGIGLAAFLWLSPEDNQVWPVVLLGTALGVIGTALAVANRFGGRVIPAWGIIPALALLGAVTGAASTLAAVMLMFLKTALHSHSYPDYPPGLMLAMLERLPAWALAGLLAGIAAGLFRRAWMSRKPASTQSE